MSSSDGPAPGAGRSAAYPAGDPFGVWPPAAAPDALRDAAGPPTGGIPDGGPAGPGRTAAPEAGRTRKVWRRSLAGGVALLAVGLVVVGFALGWSARTVIGGPEFGDTKVQVVAAPSGAAAAGVALPDVRGLPLADAQQAMVDAGLAPASVRVVNAPSGLPAGTIVRQDPVGGTKAASSVSLFVSVPGVVPELTGGTAATADQALGDLGVRIKHAAVYDPSVPEGTVVRLDPPAGSPLPELVTVSVSGPASSVFLGDLHPADGGCSAEEAGVNGTTFPHSLVCSAYSGESVTTYLLNRLTASVDGTLGVLDQSDPDTAVSVTIIGDGQVLTTARLTYGKSTPFKVSTAGVLRLEIHYQSVADASGGQFALGDARAVGSPDDISTLAHP